MLLAVSHEEASRPERGARRPVGIDAAVRVAQFHGAVVGGGTAKPLAKFHAAVHRKTVFRAGCESRQRLPTGEAQTGIVGHDVPRRRLKHVDQEVVRGRDLRRHTAGRRHQPAGP